jgi:hypothetical protein
MFASVSKHFANLQQVKDVNIASEPECTISRYQSRETSPIGPKLGFGSVAEHFFNLQHVKDVKLASEPQCTISGYQSRETSQLDPK